MIGTVGILSVFATPVDLIHVHTCVVPALLCPRGHRCECHFSPFYCHVLLTVSPFPNISPPPPHPLGEGRVVTPSCSNRQILARIARYLILLAFCKNSNNLSYYLLGSSKDGIGTGPSLQFIQILIQNSLFYYYLAIFQKPSCLLVQTCMLFYRIHQYKPFAMLAWVDRSVVTIYMYSMYRMYSSC